MSDSVRVASAAPDVMPSFGNGQNAGRIGRYQIIKTLGEGSFGKVKRMCLYCLVVPMSNCVGCLFCLRAKLAREVSSM
jgi:hypothetical protein